MDKDLFSKDMLLIEEYGLKGLIRYNNIPRIKNESVAEHSFYVVLFGLKLIERYKGMLTEKEERDILVRAAIHDTGEIKISDIPYPLKRDNPQIKEITDKIENDYISERWGNVINGDISPMVEKVVHLADALSVLQYCFNEKTLGNTSEKISEIIDNAKIRCEQLDKQILEIGDKRNAKE